MNRPQMSGAASALHRQLIRRAGTEQHRIFLSSWISTDWHSLTFSGERHQASYVLSASDPDAQLRSLAEGLEEAEFNIPRGFLAEIAFVGSPVRREDGAMLVELEALTLQD